MLDPATVHTDVEAGSPVVVAAGEIDMATAPMLERELLAAIDAGEGAVVLDLCDVTFFDSSGLRAAIVAHRELTDRGRRLSIACDPDGHVWRTFSLAGVDRLLNLQPTRAAALEDAASGQG